MRKAWVRHASGLIGLAAALSVNADKPPIIPAPPARAAAVQPHAQPKALPAHLAPRRPEAVSSLP